ncbi:cytochrome b2 [Delphinella strobiligena]|nr:cytochrome b2 [Delphinella strobiligena]
MSNNQWQRPPPEETPELKEHKKPSLDSILNADDFEAVASRTLDKKTWAFYSSAATDCHTRSRNREYFSRIWMRPRILRDVKKVDTSATMLGHKIGAPLFVSPAALAKLVHPSGELGIAVGCVKNRIPQCISTNASYPVEEIVATAPEHPFFFQLYVNKDRKQSEELLKKVRALGVTAIFLTVDAPVPGKREEDERVRADESMRAPMSGAKALNDKKGGGLGRIMGSYIDSSLSWDDLPWLRRSWAGKIVLKGIQEAEDARKAAESGVDGIILSNHGGRSLDTSPPAIMTLLECQRCCPEIFDKIEVYVDGGIRRGTDVLKCLCLGATAVGMGRSPLYAVNYGKEGVEHLIDIMKDEIETTMKLLGITDLSQVHPGLVNTLDVDHLVPTRLEHPYATRRPKIRSLEKARL